MIEYDRWLNEGGHLHGLIHINKDNTKEHDSMYKRIAKYFDLPDMPSRHIVR